MLTDDRLRYIDSDGHILEHPAAMPDYAPVKYRDRIWHIETDEAGEEWLVYNGNRTPSNGLSAAGVAGASDEDRARAFRGEMRYTETRPAAWNAKARLQDMDQDHIDLAVLYPTMLLGLQSERDVDFAEAQARAYNDWCSDHVTGGRGTAVRCRCRSADARARRRGPGRGRDPPGGRAARHGLDLHAAEPGHRLAALQRPGVRPDLAGGLGHGPAHRPPSVPLPRPARGVHRASTRPAPATRRIVHGRLRSQPDNRHRPSSSTHLEQPSEQVCSPRRSPTRST